MTEKDRYIKREEQKTQTERRGGGDSERKTNRGRERVSYRDGDRK